MKTEAEVQTINDLNQCVSHLKSLLKQLEPGQRLIFINELMVRLMPSRNKSSSSNDKVNARMNKSEAGLTNVQMQLIKKVSDDTDRLFDFDGDHRA